MHFEEKGNRIYFINNSEEQCLDMLFGVVCCRLAAFVAESADPMLCVDCRPRLIELGHRPSRPLQSVHRVSEAGQNNSCKEWCMLTSNRKSNRHS